MIKTMTTASSSITYKSTIKWSEIYWFRHLAIYN